MMPKNESENAIIPDGEAVPEAAGAEAAQAENAWVEFERGRVSRRQALKKMGITSAMAAFALFSVDDLARMVGKAMQQRAADNKVVEQVAQEFQQAGVALAATIDDPNYGACENCLDTKLICRAKIAKQHTTCYQNVTNADPVQYKTCDDIETGGYQGCAYSYSECCKENRCAC